MSIGQRDEVRDLVGIFDTNDLPDARIDAAIQYGKGELFAITLKTDWDTDTTHPLFKKAEILVHYFAAFHILDRYAGNLDKTNMLRERAKEMAAELKMQFDTYLLTQEGSTGSSSATRFNVATSKYKTYPLNEDSDIHKSHIIIPGD
jgi:hypothetical protein